MFDVNTNAAYRCPICGGHNCEFEDADDTPEEGYFDGAHLKAQFFCRDCEKQYDVTFVLNVKKDDGKVAIPPNTYTVKSDSGVGKVVKWLVEKLKESDAAYIESGEVEGYVKIEGSTCTAPESIALEAANEMMAAGYHASSCRYEATGCFAWIKVSKKPISGSYGERVMG